MTAKEIRKDKVNKVKEALGVTATAAKKVLRSCKWDLEAALNKPEMEEAVIIKPEEIEVEVEEVEVEPKEGDKRFDFTWKDEEGDTYQENDFKTLKEAKEAFKKIQDKWEEAMLDETWEYKFKDGEWEFVGRW